MSLVDRDNILNMIHEGMGVYNASGDRVGTVEYVKFGNEDLSKPGAQSATPDRTQNNNDSIIENFAEALWGDDDLPETVRGRLLRLGFIKVDPGLLQSDHYVTPDMIENVTTDKVFLRGRLDGTPED